MLLTYAQKTSTDIGIVAECIKKMFVFFIPFWVTLVASPSFAGSIDELAAVQITKDGMALANKLGMDQAAARNTDPVSYLGLLIRGFSILGPQRTYAESDFEMNIEVVQATDNSPTLRITHIPTSETIDFSFEPAVFATQVLFLNNCLDGAKEITRYIGKDKTKMSWSGIKIALSFQPANTYPNLVNRIGPTVAGLPVILQGLVQSSASTLGSIVNNQIDEATKKPGFTGKALGLAARLCKKAWDQK